MSLAIYNNIVEVNPLAEPRPLKVITREWGGGKEVYRDVAQLGSAPCSGRGGRKFESCHPDILKIKGFSNLTKTLYFYFCVIFV